MSTRSKQEMLKIVQLASVATAFAKYDFPVPGGWRKREERFAVYNDYSEVGRHLHHKVKFLSMASSYL